MNIETLAQNLRNMIFAKEMLLITYQDPSINPYPKGVKETMIQMLEVNITELKRLLQDVEQCAKQASDARWTMRMASGRT